MVAVEHADTWLGVHGSHTVPTYGFERYADPPPLEVDVVRLLASGLTNAQIADRLGFRDKRAVSRTNGQIYAAWGLADTAADRKTARTRAALIARAQTLIVWDGEGVARVLDERGDWVEWAG